jgi:hypothetical protein
VPAFAYYYDILTICPTLAGATGRSVRRLVSEAGMGRAGQTGGFCPRRSLKPLGIAVRLDPVNASGHLRLT